MAQIAVHSLCLRMFASAREIYLCKLYAPTPVVNTHACARFTGAASGRGMQKNGSGAGHAHAHP